MTIKPEYNMSELALDRINSRQDSNQAEFYSLTAILTAHNWTKSTWQTYHSTTTPDNRKSPPCFDRGRDAEGKKSHLFPIQMYWDWVDWCIQNPAKKQRRVSQFRTHRAYAARKEPTPQKWSAKAALQAARAANK